MSCNDCEGCESKRKLGAIDEGKKYVKQYSENTIIKTTFDNLNAFKVLAVMGLKRIECFGEREEEKLLKIFNRNIE